MTPVGNERLTWPWGALLCLFSVGHHTVHYNSFTRVFVYRSIAYQLEDVIIIIIIIIIIIRVYFIYFKNLLYIYVDLNFSEFIGHN